MISQCGITPPVPVPKGFCRMIPAARDGHLASTLNPMTDFVPLLGFRTGHRQTILGHFARKWLAKPPGDRRRVPLPDGDAPPDVHHALFPTPATRAASRPDCPWPGRLARIGLGPEAHLGVPPPPLRVAPHQSPRLWRQHARLSPALHAGNSADILDVLRQAAAWDRRTRRSTWSASPSAATSS